MPAVSLVWFKRDLRVCDAAPLAGAAQIGPVLPLYCIEPDYWQQPYTSPRQWHWIRDAVAELDTELTALGQPLWVEQGEVVAVFESLWQRYRVTHLWSHAETGPDWTYARDRRVADWCDARGVQWTQSRQDGVIRGLRQRTHWAAHWERVMRAPQVTVPRLDGVGQPPRAARQILAQVTPTGSADASPLQPSGRQAGLALLRSFLQTRAATYRRGMSSPLTAQTVCSRLSPHLAYGTLSLKEVFQAADARRTDLEATRDRSGLRSGLSSFTSRLHWHCHFMQKLETEPRIEFEPMHRGFLGFQDMTPETEGRLARFSEGQLGWPFVDACLRALAQTGWLNFRMRAMLAAIAAYHLAIDWRATAQVMARWFTDFEAGIHFSQMQMQSGLTGINVNRIYNPIKQSMDQDPDGVFIREFVPELAPVPTDWIHAPWRMPMSLQRSLGVRIGHTYPTPVGDPVQMAREAKQRLSEWIATHAMTEERDRILKTHASKMRQPRPRYAKTAPRSQLSLEWE